MTKNQTKMLTYLGLGFVGWKVMQRRGEAGMGFTSGALKSLLDQGVKSPDSGTTVVIAGRSGAAGGPPSQEVLDAQAAAKAKSTAMPGELFVPWMVRTNPYGYASGGGSSKQVGFVHFYSSYTYYGGKQPRGEAEATYEVWKKRKAPHIATSKGPSIATADRRTYYIMNADGSVMTHVGPSYPAPTLSPGSRLITKAEYDKANLIGPPLPISWAQTAEQPKNGITGNTIALVAVVAGVLFVGGLAMRKR